MKVKFRFGIKSYSGTLDELNYANYEDRSVVIGRMLPVNRETTSQNENLKTNAQAISEFYSVVSDGFKEDLKAYAKKMYKLAPYRKQIAGNRYTVFVKLLWAVSRQESGAIDLTSLSIDDAQIGSYENFSSIKSAVENDLLPKVDGYEDYTNLMAE